MVKNTIINEIIRVEGGYVNDPRDSGGETNFGITVAVARANGYNGPMRDMPRSVAFDIYSAKYWDAVRGDDLVKLSEGVAEEVVDTSVNMGSGRAGKFLQRALNVLGDCGLNIGDRCKYLNMIGVPEWDSTISYTEGSWTRGESGIVYFSFSDNNINNPPETSPEFWSPISADKNIGDTLISYDTEQSLVSRGYLLQNGQAVSRTTYDQLFSLIGVRFGNGDGSTTFNVKNDLVSEVSYVKAL